MGIFDALNVAVGGLQAQSFALQNISGNIANASTVGYKGIDTSFEDLIPAALTVNKQVAGGVTAHAQQTITTQGTVSSSTVATNIAINGDGFFDVQKPTGTTDGTPTFNGVTDYTRAGDFQVNAQGYLVNSAGYYLMGTAVDPKTGNPLGSVPTVLQFNNNFVPAQATTSIQYAANLPTVPVTVASPNAPAGSIVAKGGLSGADFGANNPTVTGTPPAPLVNTSDIGNAATDKNGVAITSSTLLSDLVPAVTNTDTITVDGVTINFANATPATAPYSFTPTGSPPTISLSTGDTVGALLAAMDTTSGNIGTGSTPSSVDSTTGKVTLNSGTAGTTNTTTGQLTGNGLAVTADAANIFKSLGFTNTTSTLPAARPSGGGYPVTALSSPPTSRPSTMKASAAAPSPSTTRPARR